MSLKPFIKSIRSAKTLAEERSIITKESAAIRTKLKDDTIDHETRRFTIHKLLYLYILGEKTHFAQVDTINLLTSHNFIDKRVGYLAAQLLLDENQSVLTLLTNSLNADMIHPNKYITGWALEALGNVMSTALARDLYMDILTLLRESDDPYLLKKALFVASKIVKKDPDLLEVFLEESFLSKTINLEHHGMLLGSLQWIQVSGQGNQYVPTLLKILNSVSKDFTPEYEVNGVSDPFLQVELIKTLRMLFENNSSGAHVDMLNDTLTQVATNTSPSKNTGHAVLYETVKTIFHLKCIDQSLRILGVNILGKFLTSKEYNSKYIALSTLLKVVAIEPATVTRHQDTIVKCLFDSDISIQKRALDLTFAILNQNNIDVLSKELFTFLSMDIDDVKDLKNNVIDELMNHPFSDSQLVTLLKVGGEFFNSENCSAVLHCLNGKKTLLNEVFALDIDNYGVNLIKIWIIGEFGELLHKPDDVLVSTMLGFHDRALLTYKLTAALKLSAKLSDGRSLESLRRFIDTYQTDMDLGIQIKAMEHSAIFLLAKDAKVEILQKMPPFVRTVQTLEQDTTPDLLADLFSDLPTKAVPTASSVGPAKLEIPDSAEHIFSSPALAAFVKIVSQTEDVCTAELYIHAVESEINNLNVLIAVPKTQKLQLGRLSSTSIASDDAVVQHLTIKGSNKIKLRIKLEFTTNGEKKIEQFDYKSVVV